MKALLAASLILAAGAARAAEVETLRVRACVKWSKDIPEALSAGAGLFASTMRVEGEGPFPACDVVVKTEDFGVGWLMKAWMKEGVFSPCGQRLGGFKFRYKGEEWQAKMVVGLREFLNKNPNTLAAAAPCPAVPEATAPQ